MFRSTLRPYFALLLLLCLGRTLLPEAWVLAWHPHQHTGHEAAWARHRPKSRLLLTDRHQHCHAEQLYNVPFVAGSIVQLPQLWRRRRYAPWRVAPERACLGPVQQKPAQRGPPPALRAS